MSDTALLREGRAFALSLIVVIATLSSACQRTPAPTADTTPEVTRAPFDAMLSVVNNSGSIRFDGTVNDAATKARIEQSLLSAYGAGRAAGEIAMDKAARPSKWAEGLAIFLKVFEPIDGAAVRFEGDRIVLSGKVDLEQRRNLRAAAENAFPGGAPGRAVRTAGRRGCCRYRQDHRPGSRRKNPESDARQIRKRRRQCQHRQPRTGRAGGRYHSRRAAWHALADRRSGGRDRGYRQRHVPVQTARRSA